MELKQCPYCGGKVFLKDSDIIYGKSYGYVYICENFPECDSYVGTHKKTLKPLGRLANRELRQLKVTAHKYFDIMWKIKKQRGDKQARKKAYKWLSKQLGLHFDDTHIGYFDIETTKKVIEICRPYYDKLKKVK